jgi:hypothetical protein
MRRLEKDFVLNNINLKVENTKETPREILEHHNPSMGSIPILGGWGYTQDDCVIINKNDSSVNQSMPFFGVALEYLFVEKRIYEDDGYLGVNQIESVEIWREKNGYSNQIIDKDILRINPEAITTTINLQELENLTGYDLDNYSGYLDAIRSRRSHFIQMGATATDHAIEVIHTEWLEHPDVLYQIIKLGDGTLEDARRFYGHMLIEMAQMSVDDGLTMQIHGGSRRNTNTKIQLEFGRDMGADIPISVDWVHGLQALLDRVGHIAGLTIVLFTLDESTYTRELAPMAGHWPCLRIGPPWWFHDSANGIARYLNQVVETAGYYNLAGFNDDTRAFMSIPARHDLWRRGVALHLADQVDKGLFGREHAENLALLLATDLARNVYGLGG